MAAVKITLQDDDPLKGALSRLDGAVAVSLFLGETELTMKAAQAGQLAALLQELNAVAAARQKDSEETAPRPPEPFVAGVNCDAQECPYVNARRGDAPDGQPLEICKTCGMPVKTKDC